MVRDPGPAPRRAGGRGHPRRRLDRCAPRDASARPFSADRWTAGAADASSAVAELFVGGEGLAQGAENVLATLLHEAAHGLAHARRVQDTSRQGRYHNSRFKALGEELGLTITQDPDIGWSGTALAPGTADEYAAELAGLAAAITAHRYAEGYLPTTAGPGGAGGGQGDDDEPGEGDGAGGRRRTGSCWSAAARDASAPRPPSPSPARSCAASAKLSSRRREPSRGPYAQRSCAQLAPHAGGPTELGPGQADY